MAMATSARVALLTAFAACVALRMPSAAAHATLSFAQAETFAVGASALVGS